MEIVVGRVEWHRNKAARRESTVVHFKIADEEDLLRRAVLFAGGRWNESSDTWMLERRAAAGLGLMTRITRTPPRKRTK